MIRSILYSHCEIQIAQISDDDKTIVQATNQRERWEPQVSEKDPHFHVYIMDVFINNEKNGGSDMHVRHKAPHRKTQP